MRRHWKTQINATFTPAGTYRRARSCLSSQTALAMFGRRHFGVHLGTAPGGNKNKLQLCFSRIHSATSIQWATFHLITNALTYMYSVHCTFFQVFRCLDGQVFAYFVGAVRKHPKVVAVISSKSGGALVEVIFWKRRWSKSWCSPTAAAAQTRVRPKFATASTFSELLT